MKDRKKQLLKSVFSEADLELIFIAEVYHIPPDLYSQDDQDPALVVAESELCQNQGASIRVLGFLWSFLFLNAQNSCLWVLPARLLW